MLAHRACESEGRGLGLAASGRRIVSLRNAPWPLAAEYCCQFARETLETNKLVHERVVHYANDGDAADREADGRRDHRESVDLASGGYWRLTHKVGGAVNGAWVSSA